MTGAAGPLPPQAYGLKRLVKGLGSGRQGARQGFALALALVLGRAGGCVSAQGAAAVVRGILEAGGATKVRGWGGWVVARLQVAHS